jgi:hypothetical protein
LQAPQRGEHNAELLKSWLGLGDTELSALEAEGILVTEETRMASSERSADRPESRPR